MNLERNLHDLGQDATPLLEFDFFQQPKVEFKDQIEWPLSLEQEELLFTPPHHQNSKDLSAPEVFIESHNETSKPYGPSEKNLKDQSEI